MHITTLYPGDNLRFSRGRFTEWIEHVPHSCLLETSWQILRLVRSV